MATANKTMNATKVVIPCRISFAAIFEPKSINGSEAKYSVSCLIPKEDKKTLLAIHKAIEAAKEDGKVRKWGGKVPPNLKMPCVTATSTARTMRTTRAASSSTLPARTLRRWLIAMCSLFSTP